MTYILGINAYHGDVSAVLLRDGRLVAALEEERFKRVKHWAGFPTESIRRCLDLAGIDGTRIDRVAVSRDPGANLSRKIRFALSRRPSLHLIVDRMRNRSKVRDIRGPLAEALNVEVHELPTIHNVEHHPAHLASAFFVSPFEEAAVCAIDGFGDFVSTSMAYGSGNEIDVIERVFFPHSLGMLYTAITQHLGFLNYGDEFKVMGLAPYGRPTALDEIRKLVTLKEGGRFELSLEFFRHWSDGVDMEWEEGYPNLGRVFTPELEELLGPAREPQEELTERHEDLAHSLQAVYEECAFHILNELWERTENSRLCLAGGCAMNSVANGKIRKNTPFDDVYIQPAAADNGTALGAAYYIWNQILGQPRSFVMDHAYWGTEYPEIDVAASIADWEDEDWQYSCKQYDSDDAICRATAGLIADGDIVGWFQGRMEWGARALGNRSILADPRTAETRDHINARIKLRERFRPFAPSVLEEAVTEYFVDSARDPFMQQVYSVRPDKRSVVPAVTHVDGTGRAHSVSRASNPKFYRLIEEFAHLTEVPILLNTSFNENEPIVDTPEQALDCFRRTRMDAVVVHNTIVRRHPAEHLALAAHDKAL